MTARRAGPGTGLALVLALVLLTGAAREVFAEGFAGAKELRDPRRAA